MYIYIYIYIYTDAQAIRRSCRNYRGSRRIDRISAWGWSVHGAGFEVQSYSWIQHSIFIILKPQKDYPNSQALFPKSHVNPKPSCFESYPNKVRHRGKGDEGLPSTGSC